MLIGVPKEIKDNEFRVGLTPSSVAELVHNGHAVLVQSGAGVGSGLGDEEYVAAGATIVNGPGEIFERADMIVKVKEPLSAERKLLRQRADPVHLPSPRARPGADQRPDRLARDLHRL